MKIIIFIIINVIDIKNIIICILNIIIIIILLDAASGFHSLGSYVRARFSGVCRVYPRLRDPASGHHFLG